MRAFLIWMAGKIRFPDSPLFDPTVEVFNFETVYVGRLGYLYTDRHSHIKRR